MLNIILFGLAFIAGSFLVFYVYTRVKSGQIAAKFPPVGEFYNLDGVNIHAKYIKSTTQSLLPPLVFIHGASGNLRDQMIPFLDKLQGRADLLFIDRPGHGWSDRGNKNNKHPDAQADVIAKLMDILGITKAIIIGHSFGGAVTASFALNHPEKVDSLLFLSPVAYPWPGGVRWYYTLTSWPVLGWLFAHTLALPAGQRRIESGSKCVFWPNKMPDTYVSDTGPELVLRPKTFRANAKDIVSLSNYVTKTWPKYTQIKAPTIIISGKKDSVVFPYIHSDGLHEHLDNSELINLDNMGHKPDHVATELAVSAIEKLAGKIDIDLKNMARELDEQLARQIVSNNNCDS